MGEIPNRPSHLSFNASRGPLHAMRRAAALTLLSLIPDDMQKPRLTTVFFLPSQMVRKFIGRTQPDWARARVSQQQRRTPAR